MEIEKFSFTPVEGFVSQVSFPNPATETSTREQLQRLHNQTRDKLNEVIDAIDAESEATAGEIEGIKSRMEAFETETDGNFELVGGRISAVEAKDAEQDTALSSLREIVSQIQEDIPTDEHINSLIDAKLGVIENGNY